VRPYSAELTELQALVLHHPVHIDVGTEDVAEAQAGGGGGEGEGGEGGKDAVAGPAISHFTVDVNARDKLLFCMALLRLGRGLHSFTF